MISVACALLMIVGNVKKNKSLEPWDFIPANYNERGNRPAGAGSYFGKALKANLGRNRVSSTVSPPKDITSGFKKKITQA